MYNTTVLIICLPWTLPPGTYPLVDPKVTVNGAGPVAVLGRWPKVGVPSGFNDEQTSAKTLIGGPVPNPNTPGRLIVTTSKY